MSPSTVIPPPARTWRDIPQEVTPRAMSSEGRRRRGIATMKVAAGVALVGSLAWGGWMLNNTWRHNPAAITAPVKSSPLRKIEVHTDGVLDDAWVQNRLALPQGVELMALDLPGLQAKLLGEGQVKAAVVARQFPGTLVVKLEERTPVARIAAQDGNDAPETFVVARDGVVYRGSGYTEALVHSLPFLGGVRLKRADDRFVPVDGMDKVADLLLTVHDYAPELYRRFSVVELDRIATDGEIVVESSDVKRIVFGTRDDFFRQVARLVYIVDQTRARANSGPIASVNLAVGGNQVPVAFGEPVPGARPQPPVRRAAPSTDVPRTTALTSPLFNPPNRNSSQSTIRDF